MYEHLSKFTFSSLNLPICCKSRFFKFAQTPYYSRSLDYAILLYESLLIIFFSRITTFFRASIDFLKENFEKNEIFKILDFVKFLASGVQPSREVLPQLQAID